MLGPNVKIASEKKMRADADILAGDGNLKSQLIKDGRHTVEIRNVPMCFTPNLWERIGDMLDMNDDTERRYNNHNNYYMYTNNCCNLI